MKTRNVLIAVATAAVSIFSLVVFIPILVITAGSASCAPTGGSLATSPAAISVASWNVCGASCGNWPSRSRLVAAEVSRQMPDVIAIQEGTWGSKKRPHTFSNFKRIGYSTVNNKSPWIGRYIFYRTEKLTALSGGSFSLGGHHGMAWTTFKNKTTGEKTTIVDVHLTYPKNADAERASQMRRGMDRLAKITDPKTTIWVGDFNSNKSRADDAPARIMKKAGYVDARSVAQAKTNEDVNSARGRSATAPVKRDGNQTDHIYVPKTGSGVSEWRQVVKASAGRYVAPFISDHNMILAGVELGDQAAAATQPSIAPAAPDKQLSDLASIGKWNKQQVAIAKTVISVGKRRNVPSRGAVIAVMAAIGESSLRNLDHGDAARTDTIGILQIGPEHGTHAQRMDPAWSAGNFYKRMEAVAGWQELEPTEVAHRAQRNADPNHYTQYWSDAQKLYAKITGAGLDDVSETTSTGCATGDTQQASYSSTADCDFPGYKNPKSCTQALQNAAKIASSQPCRSHLPGGTWRRWCLAFVAYAYGRPSAGYHTAMDMYRDMKTRGLINTSKTIPAGALVFFSSSSSAGHVALYNGDGKAWSNDYVRSGCIDLTPMNKMGSGGRFLGWSPPAFPGA